MSKTLSYRKEVLLVVWAFRIPSEGLLHLSKKLDDVFQLAAQDYMVTVIPKHQTVVYSEYRNKNIVHGRSLSLL
jgi:hypothetical protein